MRYSGVIKNPIMEVMWAGWRSDTLTLQQCGWQLAVEDDPQRRLFRIALHHPTMHLYGIMDKDILYMRPRNDYYEEFPPLCITHMASDITVDIRTTKRFKNFYAVDAEPYLETSQPQKLSDLVLFRPLDAIKEIIIEPKDVNEMMERILSLQAPKQAELREKARKERARANRENVVDLSGYREIYNPKTDIIAQVIAME